VTAAQQSLTSLDRSGHDDSADASSGWALALEAVRLAAVEPGLAQQLGRQAEEVGRRERDWTTISLARRARGVAAVHLRRLSEAVPLLRAAVVAAQRAGEPGLAGEARMSLASALVLRGQPAQGFAEIELALSVLTGVYAARARTQRSAILQELGRTEEALEDLRAALPALRRGHDVQWETRALSNRSLLLITRRHFVAAETDLLRARSLCTEHQLTLPGGYVEQNLGCLYSSRGDVPKALAHFDAAADLYAAHGMEVGSLLVDRAKVLMSVRLIAESRAAAEAAVATYAAQRRRVHLPEAQLLLSTAALLQGDHKAAAAVARSAAAAFARLGRSEWVTLARYAQIQAQVGAHAADGGDEPDSATKERVSLHQIRALANDLERAGWAVPALEARVLAGRISTIRGRPTVAREDFARAASARRRGPAEVRARAWLGEALLREAEGSRRGAKTALRAGLRIVEDYRASLGATELRAHVAVHRGALARTGLRLALEDGDPAAVHWWGERGRASADVRRPIRPPSDSVLAHDLEDLRTTMSEIDAARSAGRPTTVLVVRQVQLERRIRERTLTSGAAGAAAPQPPTLRAIAAELGEAALIEFVESNHMLFAVTVVAGRARLHPLGHNQMVRHCMKHLPFALHRLAGPTIRPQQLEAARLVWRRAATTLFDVLLRPIAHLLADRPLVVVPAGWLQSVPWSIVDFCQGRPVSVAPSAELWMAARHRRPISDRVVVVAGTGLSGAAAEALQVGNLYPGSTVMTERDSSASRVAKAMNGARLVHIAAHGNLRSDNPLFSSLLLADGPFTVYDIEQLPSSPHEVIMAACSTAVSHVTAGQEILGLAAALLRQQTASLVAPVVPVPDAETAPVMAALHRRLRQHLAPDEALAATQSEFRNGTPREQATAASFICLGGAAPAGAAGS